MSSAHSKRKVIAHIIDNEAIQILNSCLPKHWTIRTYVPDYGVDLDIEMFEPFEGSDGSTKYDALGEHLFAQVKGTRSLRTTTMTLAPRYNVEKRNPVAKGKKSIDDTLSCEVALFKIDTSELFTIQRMGSALPVVLFLVDTIKRDVYFLCLNDYIDKVILPIDPSYTEKSSKVLHIPMDNILLPNESSLIPIKFLAKRAKIYSFFQKVNYQRHELQYVGDKSLFDQCRYFAKILLQMDIRNSAQVWPPLGMLYDELDMLVSKGTVGKYLNIKQETENIMVCENDPSEYEAPGETSSLREWILIMYLRQLWDALANLGRVYEDTCREWFLPTWFAINSSRQ